MSQGSNNARKTHCPAGHAYSGDNVRHAVNAMGRLERRCKACDRRHKDRQKQKRRGRRA